MKPTILGMGARSVVGLTAVQTAFGLRSGRFAPGRSHFEHLRGGGIGLGRLRALPDDIDGFDRLVALGAPALREAARNASGALPLFLAAPEPHPGFGARDADALVEALVETSGIQVDSTHALAAGSGGFALAVRLGLERVAAEPERPVLVGGVDSFYDAERLAHLDEQRRILSPGAPSGMMPSEGAGFLLLGARGPSGGLVVDAWAAAEETAPTDDGADEAPNLADALTMLVETAETAEPRNIPWFLIDDVTERSRHREWSFVLARRTTWAADGEATMTHLAARTGSVGASAGAIAAVWAAVGMMSGFAPASRALVVLASDGPTRGVVSIAQPMINGGAAGGGD